MAGAAESLTNEYWPAQRGSFEPVPNMRIGINILH
jgi:hypothetical protein